MKGLYKIFAFLGIYGFCHLVSLELFGQEYFSLFEPGKSWNILHWSCGYGPCSYDTYSYTIGKDTAINDVGYYEIRGHILREDTISKKVYEWSKCFQEDQMIYDFTLENGDSIELYEDSYNLMIVDSTYTVQIHGQPRKAIAFQEYLGMKEVWIEGIGSNFGIVYPGYYISLVDAGFQLLCVYVDESIEFQNAESCFLSNVSVETHGRQVPEINYSGNPNRLEWSDSSCQRNTLQIMDLNGNQLKQVVMEANSQGYLDLSDLGGGLYLYRLIGNSGVSGKFVIPY